MTERKIFVASLAIIIIINNITITPPNLIYSFIMKQHIEQALKLKKWVKVGHHIPGRVRLKYKLGLLAHIANYKSNDIEQIIASIPAFKNYKLNMSTGSIVIEYDASLIEAHWVDGLFSDSNEVSEQACYAIAQRLSLNGEG